MDELERLRVLFHSVLGVGRTAKAVVVEDGARLFRLSSVVLAALSAAVVVRRSRR